MKRIVIYTLVMTATIPVLLVALGYWSFIIWAQIDDMPYREAFWVVSEHMVLDKPYILPVLFGSVGGLIIFIFGMRGLRRSGFFRKLMYAKSGKDRRLHGKRKWAGWMVLISLVIFMAWLSGWYWPVPVGAIALIAIIYGLSRIRARTVQLQPVSTDSSYCGPQPAGRRLKRWAISGTIFAALVIPLPIIYLASSYPSLTIIEGPVQEDWSIRYWNDCARPYDMVMAESGNIYVAGYDYHNGCCYFIAKYSTGGKRKWIQYHHTSPRWCDAPTDIELDDSENVYVTGEADTVSFSSEGEKLWSAEVSGADIGVDSDGNAYVVGEWGIVKLNNHGQEVWRKRSTTLKTEYLPSLEVAADQQGNVYVMGPNVSYEVHDTYTVVKYDGRGNYQWTATYEGKEGEEIFFRDMEIDKNGDIYVAGFITSKEPYDTEAILTIKYGSDGNEKWSSLYRGDNTYSMSRAMALAVNDEGAVAVSGSSDMDTAVTIKYGKNGEQLWASQEPAFDSGFLYRNVAIDREGNVCLTRDMVSPPAGCIICKYNSNGDKIWEVFHKSGKDQFTWGVYYSARPVAIASDAYGDIYVCMNSTRYGPNDNCPWTTIGEIVKYTEPD
ncbi:MAG: hypothetical protein R6U89_10180 [Dehalococcoidia bacterium]